MEKALLRMKDRDALLHALARDAVVYAPARDRRGEGTVFRPVASASEIDLDEPNTRVSVKGVFFPQREVLLRYAGSALAEASVPHDRVVVFGVRPCDARSLTWLDGVFCGGGRVDPYFSERRANALVISFACDAPRTSCFCTSTGGSPYGTEGADVLASRTSKHDELLFEACNARGRELLETHAALFAPADDSLVSERKSREEAARAGMTTVDVLGLKSRLDANLESPLWDELSATCLGCGTCAYLCPSCHCFDITDEKTGSQGVRVRSWDTCQFSRFTLHASGHNPRPGRKARLRQRVMHKFSYAVETAGTTYCAGCGRCVRSCPVNLDIRQVVARFQALKDQP